MKPGDYHDTPINQILHFIRSVGLLEMWGIPHSATIGELLKAVFSLWSVPTTKGKLFKPIGD
jgi:hypothetical protein